MADFPTMSDQNLNISDVLAAIETTDPSFAEQSRVVDVDMTNELRPLAAAANTTTPQQLMAAQQQQQQQRVPFVEIVEQPASKALRFRYECEGRSAGSIPGVNSTPENKTFPTIRIVGYKGPAIVVVSCVTKDYPYRPHPHNLVGKEVCKKGVCRVKLSADNMTVSFDKLGIQCVKRKDIEEALNVREAEQVDPFGTGFDHKRQPTSIDLNAVRLAFQVFLEGPKKGQFKIRLAPIVSEPIFDKKANSDLVICKLSHCTATVAGGQEMILLCEKVSKEDIQVRFFEERNGQVYWEGFGDFQPNAVHKQVAISFRSPSYRSQDIDHDVDAFIQLRRPSDGAASEALHFKFIPLGLDHPDSLDMKNKRKKMRMSPSAYVLSQVQAEAEKQPSLLHQLPQYNFNIIKTEPADRLSPFGGSVASPPMFHLDGSNTGAPNMGGLRPIASPRRTPSPMECNLYNIPSQQQQHQHQQNMSNQLQPIMIQQGSTSPLLGQDVAFGNKMRNDPDPPYVLNNPNILSDAIGSALNLGNVFDGTQQNQEFNLNLSQLDNVDLNNLSISDIVKGPLNGEEASAMEESGMTDSLTKLARNTIQDLCELNDMYKPTREDMN